MSTGDHNMLTLDTPYGFLICFLMANSQSARSTWRPSVGDVEMGCQNVLFDHGLTEKQVQNGNLSRFSCSSEAPKLNTKMDTQWNQQSQIRQMIKSDDRNAKDCKAETEKENS